MHLPRSCCFQLSRCMSTARLSHFWRKKGTAPPTQTLLDRRQVIFSRRWHRHPPVGFYTPGASGTHRICQLWVTALPDFIPVKNLRLLSAILLVSKSTHLSHCNPSTLHHVVPHHFVPARLRGNAQPQCWLHRRDEATLGHRNGEAACRREPSRMQQVIKLLLGQLEPSADKPEFRFLPKQDCWTWRTPMLINARPMNTCTKGS